MECLTHCRSKFINCLLAAVLVLGLTFSPLGKIEKAEAAVPIPAYAACTVLASMLASMGVNYAVDLVGAMDPDALWQEFTEFVNSADAETMDQTWSSTWDGEQTTTWVDVKDDILAFFDTSAEVGRIDLNAFALDSDLNGYLNLVLAEFLEAKAAGSTYIDPLMEEANFFLLGGDVVLPGLMHYYEFDNTVSVNHIFNTTWTDYMLLKTLSKNSYTWNWLGRIDGQNVATFSVLTFEVYAAEDGTRYASWFDDDTEYAVYLYPDGATTVDDFTQTYVLGSELEKLAASYPIYTNARFGFKDMSGRGISAVSGATTTSGSFTYHINLETWYYQNVGDDQYITDNPDVNLGSDAATKGWADGRTADDAADRLKNGGVPIGSDAVINQDYIENRGTMGIIDDWSEIGSWADVLSTVRGAVAEGATDGTVALTDAITAANTITQELITTIVGAESLWNDFTSVGKERFDWSKFLDADLWLFFPFCLPWDLYEVLKIFNAEPQAPYMSLPLNTYFGDFNLEVDLSAFDDVALVCRRLELALFVAGLIFVTKNMIRN